MKTILATFAALSAIALAATNLTVTWDEMPDVDGFHIYSGAERIGTATVNEAAITIPDNATTLTVSAFNERGEGPKSEPLVIPPLPPKVQAFLVTIEGQLVITIKPAPAQ